MAELEQLVQQGTLTLLLDAYACQSILSLHAHCLMRMGRSVAAALLFSTVLPPISGGGRSRS
jgi:hypothetical protein